MGSGQCLLSSRSTAGRQPLEAAQELTRALWAHGLCSRLCRGRRAPGSWLHRPTAHQAATLESSSPFREQGVQPLRLHNLVQSAGLCLLLARTRNAKVAPLPELMEGGVQKQALGQVVVCVCGPGVGWGDPARLVAGGTVQRPILSQLTKCPA